MSARALALAGALAGLACTIDTSGTLCADPNAEIVLTARVDDTGTNVRVELAFAAVGSSISRGFCVDDTVEVNGQVAAAVRKPSGNTVFALNLAEPATTYTIAVTREEERHEVQVTADAPPLTINAPANGASISRASPLSVAWSPFLGEPAAVVVIVQDEIGGGSCLDPLYRAEVADVGAHSVPAGALSVASGLLEDKASCAAFVEVYREEVLPLVSRAGEPFHADSRLIAATERTIDFTSTP